MDTNKHECGNGVLACWSGVLAIQLLNFPLSYHSDFVFNMNFDLNTIWFILVGVLFTGYAMLDGFDLGIGALHLFTKDDTERRIVAQRHRAGLGRQRSLARHRRRRAVRRVPERLCDGLFRFLPRVHAAAGGADFPRRGHRIPQQTADALVAADVGHRLFRRQHRVRAAHRRGDGQHRLGHSD